MTNYIAWLAAVDRELVACGSTAYLFESAAEAVATLINWRVEESLDPAVSAEARALRDTYLAERDALRAENERLRAALAVVRESLRCSSNNGDHYCPNCDRSVSHHKSIIDAAIAAKEKP